MVLLHIVQHPTRESYRSITLNLLHSQFDSISLLNWNIRFSWLRKLGRRMPAGLRQFLSFAFWLLEWAALVALATTGFALDIQIPAPNQPRLFLQGSIEFVQSHATWIGVSLGSLVLILRIGRWFCGGKSKEALILDRLTTDALDKLRETCFPNLPANEPVDHNRVTVFRHSKCVFWIWPFRGVFVPWGIGRWPWSGWLVIFQRSGHVTQSRTTAFLAPDDAQHSEGVAGQAWRRQVYRVGQGERRLPNLRGVHYVGYPRSIWWRIRVFLGKTSPEIEEHLATCMQVRQYAEATHCSTRFVWQRIRKARPCPTSIVAVPLLNKNKERWGVVVMDSCNQFECVDVHTPEFRRALTRFENWMHGCNATDA